MAGIIFSQGSGVNDSVFGKSQEPIKMFLESKVEAFENESALKNVFFMDKSNNFAEKLTGMTAMNGFNPVGEGAAYPKDEMQEGYDKVLKHVTWKDSFPITQEMIEDAKTLDLRKKPTAFINGYNRTREMFGAALLGGAVNGSSIAFRGRNFDCKSADGKAMFATDHPSILTGNTQANKFTDAFSDEALNKAECTMQDFRGDNGEILAVSPNTIIIPNDPTLKKNVFAAIGADKDPTTANNGFNYQFGRWRVIVWAYLNQYLDLSTNKPWILADTQYNEEVGGAVWLDRIELTVKSYIDENTDDNIWKGRSRFIAGFNDWRAFLVAGCASGSTL